MSETTGQNRTVVELNEYIHLVVMMPEAVDLPTFAGISNIVSKIGQAVGRLDVKLGGSKRKQSVSSVTKSWDKANAKQFIIDMNNPNIKRKEIAKIISYTSESSLYSLVKSLRKRFGPSIGKLKNGRK